MVAVANICMTPTSLKTAVDIKTKWRICFSLCTSGFDRFASVSASCTS